MYESNCVFIETFLEQSTQYDTLVPTLLLTKYLPII